MSIVLMFARVQSKSFAEASRRTKAAANRSGSQVAEAQRSLRSVQERARYAHLAQAFLRGVPYKAVELDAQEPVRLATLYAYLSPVAALYAQTYAHLPRRRPDGQIVASYVELTDTAMKRWLEVPATPAMLEHVAKAKAAAKAKRDASRATHAKAA